MDMTRLESIAPFEIDDIYDGGKYIRRWSWVVDPETGKGQARCLEDANTISTLSEAVKTDREDLNAATRNAWMVGIAAARLTQQVPDVPAEVETFDVEGTLTLEPNPILVADQKQRDAAQLIVDKYKV